MDGWEVRISAYGIRHVLPVGDLKEHLADDCPCAPRTEDEVIIHNSWATRE